MCIPQARSFRPKKYAAQMGRALVIIGLASALSFAQEVKPNFSGHWQVDKSQSKVVSPGKMQVGSIVQVIDHREPEIHITRIIHRSGRDQKLNLYVSTDGVERINVVENREFSFRTRWMGNNLVTVIKPAGSVGQVVMKEVWGISKDGKTLTIELYSEGAKNNVREIQVYRKTHSGE